MKIMKKWNIYPYKGKVTSTIFIIDVVILFIIVSLVILLLYKLYSCRVIENFYIYGQYYKMYRKSISMNL